MTRRYEMKQSGVDMAALEKRVCQLFEMSPQEFYARGKYKKLVEARSVFCFFAVTELQTTLKDLAVRFGVSEPAISLAVKKGRYITEKIDLKII